MYYCIFVKFERSLYSDISKVINVTYKEGLIPVYDWSQCLFTFVSFSKIFNGNLCISIRFNN